jgi:hypothetical protein
MEISSHSTTDFTDNSFKYNSDSLVLYVISLAKYRCLSFSIKPIACF